MMFNHYYRNNPFDIYRQYKQLQAQNEQLRKRIKELKRLVGNQNLRANDQNWEMHLADQGNTNFSSAILPADLTLLTLKKDPFNNASALFSVNQNQLYSVERISKKYSLPPTWILIKRDGIFQ